MTMLGFVIGELTSLTVLIQLLTTVLVLVQALAQILALIVLRHRQPELRRPYRQFLYPLPSIVAAVGWTLVYVFADKNAPGCIRSSCPWPGWSWGSSHSCCGRGPCTSGPSDRRRSMSAIWMSSVPRS